jgi:hypothetical protein
MGLYSQIYPTMFTYYIRSKVHCGCACLSLLERLDTWISAAAPPLWQAGVEILYLLQVTKCYVTKSKLHYRDTFSCSAILKTTAR